MSTDRNLVPGYIGTRHHLDQAIDRLEHAADASDPIAALRWINKASDGIAAAATQLAQQAYNEGRTKKQIAEAIGISASALRGLEKS